MNQWTVDIALFGPLFVYEICEWMLSVRRQIPVVPSGCAAVSYHFSSGDQTTCGAISGPFCPPSLSELSDMTLTPVHLIRVI